jgi:hypothetical protein
MPKVSNNWNWASISPWLAMQVAEPIASCVKNMKFLGVSVWIASAPAAFCFPPNPKLCL